MWLNAMHYGKKWWIWEFVAPYIFPLNPDYVAARSLRSLRSKKWKNEIKILVGVKMILSCWTNVLLVSCHPLMNKYTVETALLRKCTIFKKRIFFFNFQKLRLDEELQLMVFRIVSKSRCPLPKKICDVTL